MKWNRCHFAEGYVATRKGYFFFSVPFYRMKMLRILYMRNKYTKPLHLKQISLFVNSFNNQNFVVHGKISICGHVTKHRVPIKKKGVCFCIFLLIQAMSVRW